MGTIVRKLKELALGLAVGMEKANDEILQQCDGSSNAPDSSHHKQIESNTLLKALLNGEITEEVEQFRYAFYKVYEASKKRKIDPTTAMRYQAIARQCEADGLDIDNIKDPKLERDLNMMLTEVKVMDSGYVEGERKSCFMQYIHPVETLAEAMENALFDEVYNYNVTIGYRTFPMRRIENYAYAVSVDEEERVCRFHFYKKQYNVKATGFFINNLLQLAAKSPSDPRYYEQVLGPIDSVEFLTDRAKGINDNMLVKVDGLRFDPARFNFSDNGTILTFDMPYGECYIESRDPRVIYFNEAMEQKYAERAAKEQKLSVLSMDDYKDEHGRFVCQLCGTVMTEVEAEYAVKNHGYVVCEECFEKIHNKDND